MPVDKFGRNDDIATTTPAPVSSSHIPMTQINNTFLRRDGSNIATGNLDMGTHKVINVVDPTTEQEVASKNYVDLKVSNILPSVTSSDNGSFLQVLSGVWTKSGIRGISITDLNDNNLKPGAIYVFNNGTVTNPIPGGGTLDFVMLVVSVPSLEGGVDNTLLIAGSIGNPPNIYIRSKQFGITPSDSNWVPVAIGNFLKTDGTNNMTASLNMGLHKINNVADPTLAHDVATMSYVDTSLSFMDRFPPVDMTGLTTPGSYVVTSSDNDNDAWGVFAHVAPHWVLPSNPNGAWVKITSSAGTKFIVKRIVVRGCASTNICRIRTWKIEGSNDDRNWNRLADHSSDGGGSVFRNTNLQILIPENNAGYSMYRFTCMAGAGNATLNYIGLYNGINTVNVWGDNDMLGDIFMSDNYTIKQLREPTNSQDAATKSYVDRIASRYRLGTDSTTTDTLVVTLNGQAGPTIKIVVTVTLAAADSDERRTERILRATYFCSSYSTAPLDIRPLPAWFEIRGGINLYTHISVNPFLSTNTHIILKYHAPATNAIEVTSWSALIYKTPA